MTLTNQERADRCQQAITAYSDDDTFTNLVVSSVSWASDSDSPMEKVTFLYQALTISYATVNAGGTLDQSILGCYDFVTSTGC